MTEQSQIEETETPKKNRRPNGLLVFALILAAVFAISYRPSVEAVYCTTDALSTNPDVIMLGASWCPYCSQARRYFVNNNVNYCEYDIEDSGKGEQLYSRTKNQGMPQGIPILFIGKYRFSGFDERSVEKILSELKPQ